VGDSQRVPYEQLISEARERFEDGKDFTVAVEEEFALLEPETLGLTNRFEELQAASVGTDLEPHVVGELIASEVEVRTGRCDTFGEAAARMGERRRQLTADVPGRRHPPERAQAVELDRQRLAGRGADTPARAEGILAPRHAAEPSRQQSETMARYAPPIPPSSARIVNWLVSARLSSSRPAPPKARCLLSAFDADRKRLGGGIGVSIGNYPFEGEGVGSCQAPLKPGSNESITARTSDLSTSSAMR